jgi:hypothetical protein
LHFRNVGARILRAATVAAQEVSLPSSAPSENFSVGVKVRKKADDRNRDKMVKVTLSPGSA